MTTQLPNGYEAVKVPEGAIGIIWFAATQLYGCELPSSIMYEVEGEGLKFINIQSDYSILGRADELTEEQCGEVVEQEFLPDAKELMWVYKDYLDTTELNAAYFLTALESFRSLLASLHLEPHTTIILKKENV